MIGYLILGTALAGTGTAAYLDLKTTEVPDEVSILTAAVGILLHAVMSYLSYSWAPLVNSIATGVVFFSLGWLIYLMGGWGGADAFVLGATGFAIPYLPSEFAPMYQAAWPFQITLIFNVFIVGAVYSLIYAAFIGLRSRKVMEKFQKSLSKEWKNILGTILSFTVLAYLLVLYSQYIGVAGGANIYSFIALVLSISGMLILYRYLKAVEEEAMKNEIDTEDLKPGDVLAEEVDTGNRTIEANLIRGLTKGEIVEVRENRAKVTIRHGVQFVLSFPVAIIVSVFLGDLIYMGLAYSL